MKRRLLTLLAFLLVLLLAAFAAGCGGDDDDEGENGETAAGDVSGSITVMGIWTGDEQRFFQAVIDAFREQYPNVNVRYNPAGNNLPTILGTAIEGGNPPDIATPAQPGFIQQLVDGGSLKPIEFARDTMETNFAESVVEVGTFNDELYGLVFKISNKSLVWYNVETVQGALGEDWEPPTDWDAFIEDAETIKASGTPAFSLGGSEGWTLTDLFENIYIRSAGAEMYDQLARHEIPWTHESVKEALREMAKVVGDPDNIAGGTSGAVQTDFNTSVSNVFSRNPDAAMVLEGDFVPAAVESPIDPITGYDVFEFPAINDSPASVVGSGDIVVMLKDNPAARAFVEYLATPEAAEVRARLAPGYASANQNLDPEAYTDDIQRKTASAVGEAEAFRFDLSDLQPGEFGATEGQGLWKLFQDFVQNSDDVDGIAQQMEKAAAAAFE
jgi:ABC-type glycerol-3-phosphate transport system substrate-binding protein